MGTHEHHHGHQHGEGRHGEGGDDPAAFFDEAAATWDDDPAKVEGARLVADVITRALPLTPRTRVLDYGAGTGLLGRALADRVGHVTLADASAGMTEVNQRRIVEDGSDMSARRLDLVTDPVPDEDHDLVVSLMALHHVAGHGVDALPRVLSALHELCTGWIAVADRADVGLAAALEAAGFTGVETIEVTSDRPRSDAERHEHADVVVIGQVPPPRR